MPQKENRKSSMTFLTKYQLEVLFMKKALKELLLDFEQELLKLG
ncbi:unnamed protein product [marine sediment metagenome]|uniref:Uncharacterized protein n=1 Tax=marine sediment metagenome TaxID=412755 RepID=X0U558_9ZZZZ